MPFNLNFDLLFGCMLDATGPGSINFFRLVHNFGDRVVFSPMVLFFIELLLSSFDIYCLKQSIFISQCVTFVIFLLYYLLFVHLNFIMFVDRKKCCKRIREILMCLHMLKNKCKVFWPFGASSCFSGYF